MATNELTLRLGADSTALNNGLRASASAINSFSGKTRATFSRLGSSISSFSDRAITPMTGLLLGGSLTMAAKGVGDLSQSLMYYGMSAKKSDKDTAALRKSLHQMAMDTGVDADQILAGMSKIGEVTGDFDLGEKMGLNLAKASKASQASVEDLATVASAMNNSFSWGADQIQQAFNALIVQGDAGSYTLQALAGEGKALLAAAKSFGVKSTDQFSSFGAYLQVINADIKSEAETTTSVSTLFSELIVKQKELKKIGVSVFNADGSIKNFDIIMRELMAATDGNIKKISPMFAEGARKALIPIMSEYKKGWTTLDTITTDGMKAITNTDELDKRFAKTADDFNTNIAKMKASAVSFADTNLTGPITSLSEALKFLNGHQEIVSAGFKLMAGAALALTLVKIGGFIGQIRGVAGDLTQIWKGKGKEASSSSADLSVQRVFVTNMGGGLGGSYYDDIPMSKKSVTASLPNASVEIGKFGKGLSAARSGLNKFGGTLIGGSLLTAATGWATQQIYDFGKTFIEWRNTVAEANAANAKYIAESGKAFSDKYKNKEANKWASLYDKKLQEYAEEGNKVFSSKSKLEQLSSDLTKYRKLMANELKNPNPETAGLVVEKSSVLPQQNIFINFDGLNTSVKTNVGKAPVVKSTKALAGGRA